MSNQAPVLTQEEAHNALQLLERVETKGVFEAVVLARLASKLAAIKQHEDDETVEQAIEE